MKDAKLHLALVGKRLLCLAKRCSSKDVHMGICYNEAAWRGELAVRHSSSASDWPTEGRKRARQARATANSASRPRLIAVQIKRCHPIIVVRSFGRTRIRHHGQPFSSRATGKHIPFPAVRRRHRSMQRCVTWLGPRKVISGARSRQVALWREGRRGEQVRAPRSLEAHLAISDRCVG